MIVVDTNVIAYLWIPCELSSYSEKTLLKDKNWVSSHLWQYEFKNLLSRYIRTEHLDLNTGKQIFDHAKMLMKDRVMNPPSELLFDLSINSKLSLYDLEFVALAKHLETNLITSDKKLIKEFPNIVISLRNFA